MGQAARDQPAVGAAVSWVKQQQAGRDLEEAMGRLEGRVAIITGGASGIGRATVERFAQEGAMVVIADRQAEEAERLAARLLQEGQRALAITCDVADDAKVQAMVTRTVQECGRPVILFNNAGVDLGGTVLNTTPERWQRTLEVNLSSVYRCSRAVLPHMIAAGGGVIINTSSVQGLYGFPSYAAYATSKAGIIGLTRQMAIDYASRGIRVNAICPGAIATGLAENTRRLEAPFPQFPEPPATPADGQRPAPLGIGRPEHIAGAALFLASDDAAYVTGQALVVDGGMSARVY
jgi:NAD(P)-dependent dehydrogenase (short-subunit alcohol dehydrogenase family)